MEPTSPSGSGLRAFWIAFALCAAPPFILLALSAVVQGDAVYGLLLIGALVALVVDLGTLGWGIARLIRGNRAGWGTLVGALAGSILGFGGCLFLGGL